MRTRSKTRRLAAAMLTFAVAFTVIPMLTGEQATYAATKKPAATKILKATPKPVSVTLKWKKVRGAGGYMIYRNGKLKKTIGSGSKVTFTDKKLKANTAYRYKVRAFRKYKTKYGTKKLLGKMSRVKVVKTKKPAAPTLKLSATKYEASCDVELTWNKVPGAKKYVVYRNGSKLLTTTSTDALNTIRAAGTYSYTVRSYASGGYSAASNAKSCAYGSTASGGDIPVYDKDDPTLPDPPSSPTHRASNFGIDKNVKFTYAPNGTSFYLGQKWTPQLQSSLMGGTSGMEKVTRPKVISISEFPSTSGPSVDNIDGIDQHIYMFDIGDYSDFLAVYVADNQILQWRTTCKNMGSDHGVALTRGTVFTKKSGNEEPYEKALISYRSRKYIKDDGNRESAGEGCFPGVPDYGIVVGGYSSQNKWIRDPNGNRLTWGIPSHIEQDRYAEKRIGFHFINALRVATRTGLKPYRYNDRLDGHDYEYTVTTASGEEITIRLGAQPWAETMNASGIVTHGKRPRCELGPMAGDIGANKREYEAQVFPQFKNTHGQTLYSYGENVGTGSQGEACISVYENSPMHEAAMFDADITTEIGIGFSGGQHCEEFGYYY